MEPQFENRYYSTYKQIAEFARKYMTGPRPILLIIFGIFYGVLLLGTLLGDVDYEGLRYLIILGLCFLILAFLPNLTAWQSIRQLKKQNDGVIPETVTTFGDTIEIHEGMVHITIEYRKIIAVRRLKHSYMLMIGKRNGVMLDADGFTKGTFAEFRQFLKEKRPDLQIPE